jgi:hypothetical protein
MPGMGKHSPMEPGAPASRGNHRWLLFAIAIPAAVEVWACWVGLGSLCGFPKLGSLSTDWTLAIGMEAYGGYALYVWLGAAPGQRSRAFAMWSSLGAFTLSLGGQVAYHLMLAKHVTRAPAGIIVFVACLLVVILAFAAILTHLMHADSSDAEKAAQIAEAENARAIAAAAASDERTALRAEVDALRGALETVQAERDSALGEASQATATAEALARKLADTGPGTSARRGSGTAARHKPGTAARKSAAKDPEAQAAEIVTHAEAELILAAEPGISGSELGRRLGTTPGYGRTLKRKLTQVGQGGGD